jgi:hypothetical protein
VPPADPTKNKSFLVLFFKKEQTFFFFEKKKQKTFDFQGGASLRDLAPGARNRATRETIYWSL